MVTRLAARLLAGVSCVKGRLLDDSGQSVTEVLIILTVIVAALLVYLLNLSGTLKSGFSWLTSTIGSNLP